MARGRGGLELYMAKSVMELSNSHRVFAVIDGTGGIIKEYLEDCNFPYINYKLFFSAFPLLAAWRLARFIDREGIEVIHAHSRKDLPFASLAKWVSRKKPKLLFTRQMKISHGKDDPYHNFLYSQVDVLITITRQLQEQVRERLNEKFRERVKLLYYGTEPPQVIDDTRINELKNKFKIMPGQFVVGVFGKITRGKGQHILIEALGMLKKEGLNFKALIVGPKEEKEYLLELDEMVENLALAGEVVFMDFVKNPQELMQICDCVVLTTFQETFGLVLIEAMSMGKAVIGSDKGGVPEIIDDGKNGLLFESKNSRSLYTKLSALYHDREKLREFGQQGRKKASEWFNLKKHYEELQNLMR